MTVELTRYIQQKTGETKATEGTDLVFS